MSMIIRGSHPGWRRSYSTPIEHTPMPDINLAKGFVSRCRGADIRSCYERVIRYPKMIRNYLRTASHLHRRGQIALVHGQNCGWSIPQQILKSLGYRGLQLLRIPDPSIDQETPLQQIRQRVNRAKERHQQSPLFARCLSSMQSFAARSIHLLRFDHHEEYRSLLLATTVGALQDGGDSLGEFLEESPLYYVFGGFRSGKYRLLAESYGNFKTVGTVEFGHQMIESAMRTKGYAQEKIGSVVNCLPQLYEQAFSLPIGQLMVIGVPKELSGYIYHCRPYGFPIGTPINELPMQRGENHQARIILAPEILDSERVTVINAMNSDEVEALCGLSDDVSVEECMQILFSEASYVTEREREFIQYIIDDEIRRSYEQNAKINHEQRFLDGYKELQIAIDQVLKEIKE